MTLGDPPPASRATAGAQGWECPRCHATYAPWVASCSECKPPPCSLRDRLTDAQPTTPVFPALPAFPYVPPPVYPAPLFPAPQWPHQDRIVWCGPLSVALPDWVRLTMGAGAAANSTYTITLNSAPEPGDDDDGTAGVPAKV